MGNIWVHNGIRARAKPFDPKMIDIYDGSCIVLGCSRNAWKDYAEAVAMLGESFHVMAVNDIAHQIRKPINHIVSAHKELPGPLRKIRKIKMLEDVVTHSTKPYAGVDHAWGAIEGNSGMFAVKIALLMGYTKIIVCGIAMDGTGHYYDPDDHMGNGSGTFDDRHRVIWRELHRDSPEARSRVRVMSGTQMDLYTRPTPEWVCDKELMERV